MSIWKPFKRALLVASVAIFSACGGGGGGDAGTPFIDESGSSGSGSGSGSGTTTSAYTLELSMLDADGAVTKTVAAGTPVRVQAVVKKDGVALDGEVVSFSLDSNAASVAQLTASNDLSANGGKASVSIASLGTKDGAGTVTASSAKVTTAATWAFKATAAATETPASLTLGDVSFGSTTVPSGGTTSVRVQVLQNGQAYTTGTTVTFTTSCAAGTSTITSSVVTQPNGWAENTFTDLSCAQTAARDVTVTASISSDTSTGTVRVLAPTAGSLRFVEAVPSDKSITLKGQGGNGRQENATLTFQLVDQNGLGVANVDLCFDLTTYVGGMALDGYNPDSLLPAASSRGSDALCGTDNLSRLKYLKRTGADGQVALTVASGTVPTPVRLRARALYPSSATVPLETVSDSLSVSTGQPLQRSFSLSADQANIDGGDFDGSIATLTARLADQYSNPVPDGTVVNFIASGAAVCRSTNGSCSTVNGSCACEVVSQNRRPDDNRVIVMAYAEGLEDFDDNDGDNVYTAYPSATAPQKCTDAGRDTSKDCFYDKGNAFVDANKDGLSNSQTLNNDTDTLIPFESSTFVAAGDDVRGRIHVRASTVIYLSMRSGNGAVVMVPLENYVMERSLFTGSVSGHFVPLAPSCPSPAPVPELTIGLYMEDGWGNPMAAGTTLTVGNISSNLATSGAKPSTVDALGARPPSTLRDLPNTRKSTLADPLDTAQYSGVVPSVHSLTLKGVTDKCSGNASMQLEVKSPEGSLQTLGFLYTGQSRDQAAGSLDVRYRNTGVHTAIVKTNLVVELTELSVVLSSRSNGVSRTTVAAPTRIVVDWGDGTSVEDTSGTLSSALRTHTYAAAGTYIVRVSVSHPDVPGGLQRTTTLAVTSGS